MMTCLGGLRRSLNGDDVRGKLSTRCFCPHPPAQLRCAQFALVLNCGVSAQVRWSGSGADDVPQWETKESLFKIDAANSPAAVATFWVQRNAGESPIKSPPRLRSRMLLAMWGSQRNIKASAQEAAQEAAHEVGFARLSESGLRSASDVLSEVLTDISRGWQQEQGAALDATSARLILDRTWTLLRRKGVPLSEQAAEAMGALIWLHVAKLGTCGISMNEFGKLLHEHSLGTIDALLSSASATDARSPDSESGLGGGADLAAAADGVHAVHSPTVDGVWDVEAFIDTRSRRGRREILVKVRTALLLAICAACCARQTLLHATGRSQQWHCERCVSSARCVHTVRCCSLTAAPQRAGAVGSSRRSRLGDEGRFGHAIRRRRSFLRRWAYLRATTK